MKKRVLSAIVLLAVTLTFMLLGPVSRVCFFAIAGCLCAYEYSKNVEKLDAACTLWVMVTYLVLQAAVVMLKLDLMWSVCLFVFCVYLALFSGVIHKKVSGRGALFTLAGLCYPCMLFAIIMTVSVSDIWIPTLVLGCLATWVCDTFALFGGMAFGKHKIAPHISPNKTVEGCISGALSSVVSGFLVYLAFMNYSYIPLYVCLITALVASTFGQVGDLAESLLKRMIGVKDFSDLIPGHGGIFDRADSLLFSIPTAYVCLRVFGL